MARLSVVVPFHNVEDYLGATLESIARQTFRDLEVILVDDGSTDGSTLIAKSYVSRDPRFRLIQQENAGVGPARNAGIRHAAGEYLAFVDSDDLVSPHAYALLVGSLEKTGSDIATGAVKRLTATGPMDSRIHQGPFRATVLRTHVSRRPIMLQDRAVWNKVFRRSFWDAHRLELEFPGGVYEDAPTMVRAHVLASSVDVFSDVVYYWRLRESGELSITERYREIANIEYRMASADSAASFLTAHAPALKPAYDATALRSDIRMLIQAFEFATEPERARIADLAAGYLRNIDPSVYPAVALSDRLRGYLLGRGMFAELLEVLRFERSGGAETAPVERGDGPEPRWYARYPFFADPAAGVPDEIYDITSEMTLNACLDSVTWHGGKLRIEGHAYIHRLSSATPSDCQIRITLRNSRTRRTIRLPVSRVSRPDVTARSKQAATCYDWSGFVAEVSPRRLATLPGVWRAANWELRAEVTGSGLRREGPVGSVRPGSAQWPQGRWMNGSVWLQPAPELDTRFVIRGQQISAFVTACTAGEGTLDIEGWTSHPLSEGATVAASPRKGGVAAVKVPVQRLPAGPSPAGPSPAGPSPAPGRTEHRTPRKRGRHFFRASIPVHKLASPLDATSPIDRILHIYDEFTWDVSLHPGSDGQQARLAIAPATAGARVAHDGRELTAFATHFGSLSLLERSLRPVITALEWTAGRHLILRGSYTDPATRPDGLILRHVNSGQEHPLPLSWDGSAFTTEFAPGQMPGLAGTLPLASGSWHVLAPTGAAPTGAAPTSAAPTSAAPTGAGTASAVVAVAVDRRLLPGLPGYHQIGLHEVEAQPYQADALRLHVRLARSEDERGRYAARKLTTVHYPKAASGPIRDLAVFDSHGSRHFACNPRAIYEELRRTCPELECAWITSDGQFSVPEGTRLIPANSRAHVEALARARYVIANDLLPGWYRRRDGQTCLQTWHATPLKRIGMDIARPQFETGLIYPGLVASAAASWNLLLSPNPVSTPVFRRAFGYDGEILESGYPRNDPLHRPGREQRAAAVRSLLGLPAGKRVVLYAPTWRDSTVSSTSAFGHRFDLRLDLPAMADALGDDHVLLLRLHTNERDSPAARISNQFVTAVTSYPDITDLLLVSDVLITDYSSVMSDFAGTGRPVLLYTYDLENYRDRLRGFYADFESAAPGPLLASTSDIIDALRDLPGIQRSYKAAYQAFARTYCALDDGQAAARVVSRLLGGG